MTRTVSAALPPERLRGPDGPCSARDRVRPPWRYWPSAATPFRSTRSSPTSVMPGMDGPTLVRAVRGLYPNIPVILASGYAEEAMRADLAAEDIAFMPKPYALKALVAALSAACVAA